MAKKEKTSTEITQGETPSTLNYKVEKMYKLPDAGNLKAFVDLSINDAIILRGVRLVDGKKGVFVTMPQEQGKDNRWYDQIVCRSTTEYDRLSSVILEHYNKE